MNVVLKSNYNQVRLVSTSAQVVLKAFGALITNQATGATYTARYNEVYPTTFFVLPESQALDTVSVKIVESFDGTGASLKIGDSDDDDRFFSTSEVDLGEEGVVFEKGFDTEGGFNMVLTIDPGTVATQGEVLIQVSSTKKGT